MITRELIKSNTMPVTYAKGAEIFFKEPEKIQSFFMEEDAEAQCDDISAVVQGNSGTSYFVGITYNFEEDIIEDYDCDCPAYSSYPWMCKHCVAVLMRYEKEQPDRGSSFIYGRRLSDYMDNEFRSPRTDSVIQSMLEKKVLQRTAPVLQRDVFGKVKIEAELDVNDSVGVEFKIGVDRMYVMKSVFDFAENLEENAEVSYGKKLSFFHTLEAFEPNSQPMVQFIRKWCRRNENYPRYDVYGYGRKSVATSNGREIFLSEGDLELFFNAAEGQSLVGRVRGSSASRWQEVEESPTMILSGNRSENGLTLKASAPMLLSGGSNYFAFKDGKIFRIPRSDVADVRELLTNFRFYSSKGLFVANKDLPAFCRELLPSLKRVFKWEGAAIEEEDWAIPPVAFELYLDAPESDVISCKVQAVYGADKYNPWDENSGRDKRDFTGEMEIRSLTIPFFTAVDQLRGVLSLVGEEEVYEFLTEGMGKLQAFGTVFISDALKQVKIVPPPKVSVGVSLEGNLLELSMLAGDMSKEELVDILERYNTKKKYYRLKNGDFINMEDSDSLTLLSNLKETLGLTKKELLRDVVSLPKFRALYLDGQLRESDSLPAERSRDFRALIRNMKTVEDNDFEVPESLTGVLREYQKKGFLWLKTLCHNGFGGILADDMGLGKTLQVIAFLLSEAEEAQKQQNQSEQSELRPSLIVCPASLVYNWESEIERFAPALKTRIIAGNSDERRDALEAVSAGEICITSYDLLKRDRKLYEGLHFGCQVIDEAQYIKNHSTLAARAVKEVQADFKVALTGTPIENRLSELWSIFDYLMPGFLFSYERFRKEIELPAAHNQDAQALERLRKMITPFVLRRLKRDVLKDLPDKIEKDMMTRLEGEQQKLYDAHVKRLQLMLSSQSEEEFKTSKIQILAALTRLRQLCCDPGLVYEEYNETSNKTQMCIDLIANAVEGGHKILLFSQFTTMLDILARHLAAQGISYYMLTGATPKLSRAQMVQAFQEDETPLFLISLKAGGTGLNLTAADIVIHFDPWWNLAVQNQATDRAHRIGQKNVVSVYKLIAQDTIEENIIKLQEKKRELAEQILSGEELTGISFSKEELLELLK